MNEKMRFFFCVTGLSLKARLRHLAVTFKNSSYTFSDGSS